MERRCVAIKVLGQLASLLFCRRNQHQLHFLKSLDQRQVQSICRHLIDHLKLARYCYPTPKFPCRLLADKLKISEKVSLALLAPRLRLMEFPVRKNMLLHDPNFLNVAKPQSLQYRQQLDLSIGFHLWRLRNR